MEALLFLPKKCYSGKILCLKMPFRPKYLLIDRLRKNITLSGRRWKPHGSGKESSGKEAGTKEGSKEGSPEEEEIIFFGHTILHFFPFVIVIQAVSRPFSTRLVPET
ncbi:MAG TPA: hypothetical protein VLL74_07000 [Methanoregula sp.]|nr:hypothetical protein [Methanoregula sp.]